ncbi:MAG TPA: ROK family protein [Ktedonobacterales bacterium]|nr:ROK family protein [Ktedonobacterales bacterium]
MYLGIDVGGTKTQGAYERVGEITLTARLATPKDYGRLLGALTHMAGEAAESCGEPVTHIGIGVPGTVSERRVTWVPNLPYLDSKPLANDLYERTRAEVVVGNDAQFALLGEVWRGAAHERDNAVLVSVGTGVGGAIYMNGRLLRGNHGSAGAFGWLNLDVSEPPNSDHGQLELHASGAALDEMARTLDPPRTSYEVVAGARAGDTACVELIERLAAWLSAGCASIASILDPDVIIFSGGLADAFDLLEAPLHDGLRARGSPGVRETPIVVSQLGRYAAAYGALRAAMLQRAVWE